MKYSFSMYVLKSIFLLYSMLYDIYIKIRSMCICRLFDKCTKSVLWGKIGYIRGPECIHIGTGSYFGDYIYITAWVGYGDQVLSPNIYIGSNCSFGAFNHITAINKIIIGDNCLTGKWVTISDNNHGTTDITELQIAPIKRNVVSKGPIEIGKNVWIGDKVTILGGVKIGDGVVVAANSVVTKDIPSYCVVAGSPARIIKDCRICQDQGR